MSTHLGFTDRVMAFFRQHPSQWINAIELEPVGGRPHDLNAWSLR